MGAGQSTSQTHQPSHALHVLRVTPSSPASKTTIEPFFDFIVGFEGDSLSHENIDASQLERIVERHEGRTLNLLVWNSKGQQTRVVPITPSRAWSQTSQFNEPMSQPSLLGLSMRMCQPQTATENVWHVLDVIEGSPAESAGLVPMGDWILGWSGGVLGAENDFYDLVEAHIDKPLRVYVYSYDFDTLREVVLIPNRHWGGEGLLGCVFGFGLLHRIPPQPADRLPGTIPIELQQPAEEFEEPELFVPADVHPDSHFSMDQLAEWRRQEQEQWTQESNTTRSLYGNTQTHSQLERDPSLHNTETSTSNHNHKDNHDHYLSHTSNSQLSNGQIARWQSSAQDDSKTPTRTSIGPLMNGTDLGRNIFKSVIIGNPAAEESKGRNFNRGEDDEDNYDGEISVAGTETASLGSLTSVD